MLMAEGRFAHDRADRESDLNRNMVEEIADHEHGFRRTLIAMKEHGGLFGRLRSP